MLEDRETTAGDNAKNWEILCCLDARAALSHLASIIHLFIYAKCAFPRYLIQYLYYSFNHYQIRVGNSQGDLCKLTSLNFVTLAHSIYISSESFFLALLSVLASLIILNFS